MHYTKILHLKKNEDKRLLKGHVWIYSNEIDVNQSPLNQFIAGDIVRVVNKGGKALGLAYINPHTLLSARLLTHDSSQLIDQAWLLTRLQQALELRTGLFSHPYYRLVYAESDGLPGLIVDRYGDYLCAQINTAGMERLKTEIVAALVQLLQPKGIMWRNDTSARKTEGLPSEIEVAWGDIPEYVTIVENGAIFQVSLLKGQKTAWFYDHRENRALVQHYAQGKRILDLFSYSGSFAIQALVAGAHSVVAVDSSAQAIEWLQANAKLNKVSHQLHTQIADVQAYLKQLRAEGEQFDMVLLDPPAFIKRRKDIKSGYYAYQRINELAMSLVKPQGILVSSSCSLHCSKDMLMQAILYSSLALTRRLQIFSKGQQAPDHLIHPAIPETDYLKTFFMRCL